MPLGEDTVEARHFDEATIRASLLRVSAGERLQVFANANGGAYRSPSLSQYSGQVVSKPTFFAFANGGVAGETGKPEGIFPLATDSRGKLGVSAVGVGGNTVNVYLSGLGNAADVRRSGGQVGREVLRAMSGAQRFA